MPKDCVPNISSYKPLVAIDGKRPCDADVLAKAREAAAFSPNCALWKAGMCFDYRAPKVNLTRLGVRMRDKQYAHNKGRFFLRKHGLPIVEGLTLCADVAYLEDLLMQAFPCEGMCVNQKRSNAGSACCSKTTTVYLVPAAPEFTSKSAYFECRDLVRRDAAGSSSSSSSSRSKCGNPNCETVTKNEFCSRCTDHACSQCDAVFGAASSLRTHVRTVHEQRRDHACLQCDATFGQTSHLRTHVRTVHEQRRDHACLQCDATFGEAGSLRKHVRTVHKQREEEEEEFSLAPLQ